jgi:hypothetical protein
MGRWTCELIVACSLSVGCTPSGNGFDDSSQISVRGCRSCFRSQRDNPVYHSTYFFLRAGQSVFGDATGLIYAGFLIRPHVTGGNQSLGSNPTPIMPLIVEPQSGGVGSFGEGDPYPWALHGLEIGYASETVNGTFTDIQNNAAPTPLIASTTFLDNHTLLVPVQVVRAFSSTDRSHDAFLNQFGQRSWKQLFDDQRMFSVQTVSHPNEPNAQTIYSYPQKSDAINQIWRPNQTLSFDQPDEIWAQCGIQFRMIPCADPNGSNQIGCADLFDNDSYVAPSCPPLDTPYTQLLADATAVPGVLKNNEVALIVQVFQLSTLPCLNNGQSAIVLDKAEPGLGAIIGMLHENFKFVLAHELGHVLGVSGDYDCTNTAPNLMCGDVAFQNATILPQDCAIARNGAAKLANKHWGVTLQP